MSTIYPEAYDDDLSLRTVRDDAITLLTSVLEPGDTFMEVEDSSVFNTNGGLCTVYSIHDAIPAHLKAGTYRYSGVDGSRLVGLTGVNGTDVARPVGSRVVANIMAEHRNDLVDAVMAVQGVLGERGSDDESTLEFFAKALTDRVKVPKPMFDILPATTGFVFVPIRFIDRTFRLQSWQNVTWRWTFGDGSTSTERNPEHVYSSPGKYTVTLQVTNEYGDGRIAAKNAVTILGTIPRSCDVSTETSNAIAGETVVVMSSRPAVTDEPSNPVNRIEWSLEDGEEPLVGTFARFVFNQGGRYQPRITQRTVFGNFSSQFGPEVNVVERRSLWAMVQPKLSGSFRFEEYMPVASAWKSGKSEFSMPRDWSSAPDNVGRDDSFLYSGGMHDFPGTMESLVLSASSPSSMSVGEYDGLSDTYRAMTPRSRGWGWVSSRINTRDEEQIESNQVYVIFGRSNPSSHQEQDLLTVEHYGMSTRTWEIIQLSDITEGALDEEVIKEASMGGYGNKTRRWRSTSWGSSVYLFGSGGYDLMTRVVSFKPSTRTWRNLAEPSVSSRTLDMDDCAPMSLTQGVYLATTKRFMALYDPSSDSWKQLNGQAPWLVTSSGSQADPRSLLKAASPSQAPQIDGTVGYVTGFDHDPVVQYDESTSTATLVTFRQKGIVSAASVM